MSNTYEWTVTKLESVESLNGLENAVSTVYWTLTGNDGVNTTEVKGTVNLDTPDADNFIAYSSLELSQVIDWVKAKLGEKLEGEYYQYLDQKLAEVARPVAVETALPWA
jgi:hypothetical protein